MIDDKDSAPSPLPLGAFFRHASCCVGQINPGFGHNGKVASAFLRPPFPYRLQSRNLAGVAALAQLVDYSRPPLFLLATSLATNPLLRECHVIRPDFFLILDLELNHPLGS